MSASPVTVLSTPCGIRTKIWYIGEFIVRESSEFYQCAVMHPSLLNHNKILKYELTKSLKFSLMDRKILLWIKEIIMVFIVIGLLFCLSMQFIYQMLIFTFPQKFISPIAAQNTLVFWSRTHGGLRRRVHGPVR